MAFFSWLQTMSATAFVGILAFLGTVFAVITTNKATSERFQKQLVEDRRREQEARLFESRRDVYLEAAEAITVAMMCIGRLRTLIAWRRTSSNHTRIKLGISRRFTYLPDLTWAR